MNTITPHGLPDLPPHHRLVAKGTPWHKRMLWAQCGEWTQSLAGEMDPGYVYCEPTYPPIPDGYELYEGEWVEGAKANLAGHWSYFSENSSAACNIDQYATIRPIKKEPPLLTPADFMGDGPWWISRSQERHHAFMVVEVSLDGVMRGKDAGMLAYSAMRVLKWERSNDGINWQPC